MVRKNCAIITLRLHASERITFFVFQFTPCHIQLILTVTTKCNIAVAAKAALSYLPSLLVCGIISVPVMITKNAGRLFILHSTRASPILILPIITGRPQVERRKLLG